MDIRDSCEISENRIFTKLTVLKLYKSLNFRHILPLYKNIYHVYFIKIDILEARNA